MHAAQVMGGEAWQALKAQGFCRDCSSRGPSQALSAAELGAEPAA